MALGAAVQAGVLTGEVEDIVLLDVTPLSLGIETKGGVFTKLIDRNTTVPVRKSEIFSTAANNQTEVPVHVLQGERPMASDNKSLGRFQLNEIPPMPAGMPQIEITYDIDANGILNVTAREKSTGKEASITIQNTTTLSEDEVNRMVADAEANAEQDRVARELADARNQLDAIRSQAANALSEAENAPEDARGDLQAAIDAAQQKLDDGSAGKDALESEAQALGQKLQEFQQLMAARSATQSEDGQDGPSEGDAGSSGSQDDDEEVIDADFKPAN